MTWTRLDRLIGFEQGLPPLSAALVALAGLALLLFGLRLGRLALSALGFTLGAALGQQVAEGLHLQPAWGVGLGGGLLGLLPIPFPRLGACAVVGLGAGALAGQAAQALWPRGYWWAFAPACLLCGVLAFWLSRPLRILATALLGGLAFLGGAVAAVGGWLSPMVAAFPAAHPWAWLSVVGLACAVGVTVQVRFGPRRVRPDEEE